MKIQQSKKGQIFLYIPIRIAEFKGIKKGDEFTISGEGKKLIIDIK